jgi:hypothetical protein
MITHFVVRCYYCGTVAAIPAEPGAGWKFENGKINGFHLCPAHSSMTWETVKAKPATQ